MKTYFPVRLDPDQLVGLRALAAKYEKSMAALIRACIEVGWPKVEELLIHQLESPECV